MKGKVNEDIIRAIEKAAYPLSWVISDYDHIIKVAKDKQFVLIGEASHGTHEFYRARAEITQRLIDEAGYDAIAVEADWPDAYRVNRYVCGKSEDVTADQALLDFERFPTWMWRNKEVEEFVKWLHAYNHRTTEPHEEIIPVGFYGLDMYSMGTSVRAVINYLEKVSPDDAKLARERYSCLDHFIDEPQRYGYATESGFAESCEHEIIEQLMELREKQYEYLRYNGFVAEDEYFYAKQNAKVVKSAEEYYRSLYRGGRPNSWNLRDQHMAETLDELADHLSRKLNRDARIVVWAHNSHIGDASATDMRNRKEINIGQLARHEYKDKTLLVGFSTHTGTVTAASEWDAPMERKRVRSSIPGSYENIFFQVSHRNFLLDLRENNEAVDLLQEPRLQRAIGVIYRPETERISHYYYTCLPEQFDFMLHYDETNAVKPLETTMQWHKGELEETYPFGV